MDLIGAKLRMIRDFGRIDTDLQGKSFVLICVIALAVFAIGAWLLDLAPFAMSFFATILCICALVFVLASLQKMISDKSLRAARDLLKYDPQPVLISDFNGHVTFSNNAGRGLLDGLEIATVSQCLLHLSANPAALIARIRNRLLEEDNVTEFFGIGTVATKLTASRIGTQHILWRWGAQNELTQEAWRIQHPVVLAQSDGTVLCTNKAASDVFGTVHRLTDLPIDAVLEEGASCIISQDGGPVAYTIRLVSNTRDIKEFVFLPDLERADHRTLMAFDTLPVPLLKLDTKGRIQAANSEARQMLDVDAPEGKSITDFFEDLDGNIASWIEAALENGVVPSDFLRLSKPIGDVYAKVSIRAIRQNGSHIILVAMTDATELKSLEKQFVQSQKMQAIGQLAGGVAHDFNNLLTAISGHCDLLLLRHDRGDPDYADLIQINQNANRAAALVGQLLAFSRKQNMNPEHVDLRSTLSDLTHLLNRLVGEKITLSLSHDSELPTIRADKRQLEQVMMNLVVNARDAMHNGGEILIKTEAVSFEAPWRRSGLTIPQGDYVSVSVQDEGVGIPPDRLGQVFEPFYTTKRVGEGTGLGLSTVYGIVKQSGGFVYVDSVEGVGSTFTILFRAQSPANALPEPEAVEEDPRAIRAPYQAETGMILLVEDEAPVRAFASRALRLRGYTVVEASSGEEALTVLQDASLDVDVVVSDVIMPGLDGPGWIREARKTHQAFKVVFMSGYPEDAFERDGEEIPQGEFLAKPFSLKALTETVDGQMAKAKAEKQDNASEMEEA